MIRVEKNKPFDGTMTISLYGDAEEVAQEYVALTLKIHDEYPMILVRAQRYLEDILELRKEEDND